MKAKLTEYIQTIFADAERNHPNNRQLAELKEEMLQNLTEKYDDLIAGGKSPAAAFNIAISSIGDVSDLLDSVCGESADGSGGEGADEPTSRQGSKPSRERPPLTPEQESEMQKYRNRSAILTPLAIALYILCCVPAILIGDDVIGPICLFIMVAIATAILIFNSMSKPKFIRELDGDDDDDDDDDDREASEKRDRRPRRSPVYTAISTSLWILTVI